MTERDLPIHHRAEDPGGRLSSFGKVTWVHCPECDKASKKDANGISCGHCGYTTVQSRKTPDRKWAAPASSKQKCSHCSEPIGSESRPTARTKNGELYLRVRCPHCGETDDYPARPGWTTQRFGYESGPPLFLTTQVAGETLWVQNLAHLNALEDWLGAKVRERGPQPGLTMMAKLPRWMKASTNRAKVLRGLAQLRERAEKAGIDE
jgi:hypothetical protein